MNEGNYGSTFNPQRDREERLKWTDVDQTDWMVAGSRVVAHEHAIPGDNDDDKKRDECNVGMREGRADTETDAWGRATHAQ